MEEIIKKLVESKDKKIEVNQYLLVLKVTLINESDLIVLDLEKDNKIYKDLVMIKGKIYPIPKIGDILLVNKMYLKINENFKLKLYIEGSIDKYKLLSRNINIKYEYISFDINSIYESLENISKINLFPIDFLILQILNNGEEIIEVKDIISFNDYYIKKKEYQIDLMDDEEFLLIYNCEIKNLEVIGNNLTIVETLNEEKLVRLFSIYQFQQSEIFKVIDIDNDKFLLIDINENFYYLYKEEEKYKNIKFNCIVLFTNFDLNEKGNTKEIKLSNKSFVHICDQNIFYMTDLELNLISVVKFIFLDFRENENMYQYVSSSIFEKKKIKNKEEYAIVYGMKIKKVGYYPIDITLSSDKKNPSKKFIYYLYEGVLNKINVFLNINIEKTYFYEFFYYRLDQSLKIEDISIKVKDNDIKINAYDNFGSENRKRFSILNIPYQKCEKEEDELNTNSLQICELIQKDINKIIGIYDIKEYTFNAIKENNVFDIYYDDFGDVYDTVISLNKIDDIMAFFKKKHEILNSKKFDFGIDNIFSFDEIITLSQYKVRLGLLICQYMLKYKDIRKKEKKIINEIKTLDLQLSNQNIKYYDMFRLYIFILKENIDNNSNLNADLIFLSELNELSPYKLAYQFNKDEIKSMNEYNLLFQAYLQLDSYTCYNYIHNRISHSFSLVSLFMIKYELLSTYEDFFFIKKGEGKEYAFLELKTQITVINEKFLFRDNETDISSVNEINESKNYAMPITILLKHEKGGHYKFLIKNRDKLPPFIYYRGLNIEIVFDNNEGIVSGESGLIIENFYCPNKKIIAELLTKFCYGEFLSKEYFILNNNKKLINDVKNKMDSNDKNEVSKNMKNQTKKNREYLDEIEALSDLPPIVTIGDMTFDINNIKEKLIPPKEEISEINKKIYESKKIIKKKRIDMPKIKNYK